ncbi:MAG: aminopeptidase P family protein [Alphaproteobacteria bacterium]|nr:aminopeptidase P family protein [Alphaproteobacteria bacterium]
MNILLLPEKERRGQLEAAEAKASAMFDAIAEAGLIAPGKTEAQLDAEIYELAKRDFGVEKHWHRRVVRTGPNTLCTFYDHPPVSTIAPDDIVYLDLGPVFEEWEADVGRSYALGSDPDKQRLVTDLSRAFDIVKGHYERTPDVTGAELFRFAQETAQESGWEFGGVIAGHIVGEFPHAQRVPGDKDQHRIAPANRKRMRDPDRNGNVRHWILEIHLVDRARQFGGFYERLL